MCVDAGHELVEESLELGDVAGFPPGQSGLEQFAAAAPRLHVVNALTDEEHPCQAIADMLTLQQRLGPVRGRTIAYVGDGNNVAASLAHAAAMLGIHLHVASPDGYQLAHAVVQQATATARFGARLRLFDDPDDAVAGADAVYTDTWTSMGQEAEADERRCVPTCTTRLVLSAASTILRPSTTVSDSGFSTYTSLPAWQASIIISACQ